MLERLSNLPELNSISKSFASKHPDVWDICIYGSFVRGKTEIRDVDIAIIMKKPTSVENKLNLSQELKDQMKVSRYEFDVKCVDIKDFLDPSFLARTGIIGEGFLILKGKRLSEILGFESYVIFTYNLKNLSNSEKTMLNYSLNGRRGEKGMIELRNCEHLGRGTLKVPIEHSEEFKDFFERHKVKYKISKVLFY
jgi:predicted nucleotidyltransferase